jgi:hypothetical protein
MNWEKLTPILENACEKVMSIKDLDERMAMLIFTVAEFVENAERESCAKEADKWSKRDDDVGAFIGKIIRGRVQE